MIELACPMWASVNAPLCAWSRWRVKTCGEQGSAKARWVDRAPFHDGTTEERNTAQGAAVGAAKAPVTESWRLLGGPRRSRLEGSVVAAEHVEGRNPFAGTERAALRGPVSRVHEGSSIGPVNWSLAPPSKVTIVEVENKMAKWACLGCLDL